MTIDKPLPRIGADRMYWAKLLTDPTDAEPTYDTPIRLQGLVDLSETPNADNSNFYADDGVYVQTSRPGDVQAAVTVANIMPEIWALLMGASYNGANGQIKEGQNDVPLAGALGFRAQLSNGNYEYVWYKVGVFSKSAKTYTTKGESITYNTSPLTFHARPESYDAVLANRFTSGEPNAPAGLTDALLINESTGFFSDPNYVPTAPGTPIADFAIATGSAGQLDATWTAAVSASLVKIQILDPVSGNYNDATTGIAIAVGANSATITGLTSGNTYTARLVVVSGTNNGISNTDTAAAG
jgi:phi13 family phage major tail protein